MAQQRSIELDTTEFERSARQMLNVDLPKAISTGIRRLVTRTQTLERELVKRQFDLSTNWIPNNIKAFPSTPGQTNKIKQDYQRKGKFIASVSTTDRVSFMSGHDEGVIRVRDNTAGSKWTRGKLAIPGPGLTKMNYRTNSGKVRSRYMPGALLKHYQGPNGKRPGTKRKLPFVMKSKGGGTSMIVRRKTTAPRPIEVLYFLVNRARIKDRWDFTEKGVYWIKQYYSDDIQRAIRLQLRT